MINTLTRASKGYISGCSAFSLIMTKSSSGWEVDAGCSTDELDAEGKDFLDRPNSLLKSNIITLFADEYENRK